MSVNYTSMSTKKVVIKFFNSTCTHISSADIVIFPIAIACSFPSAVIACGNVKRTQLSKFLILRFFNVNLLDNVVAVNGLRNNDKDKFKLRSLSSQVSRVFDYRGTNQTSPADPFRILTNS